MKSFDDWFKELISNHVWSEPARMHHKPETFNSICNRVYMNYTACNGMITIEESRRHVYAIVCKTPGDNNKVDWTKKALEKLDVEKEKEWVPVSPEERARRLKEWEYIVANSTMVNMTPRLSYKELAEEGGVLPPKPAPYPCTSKEEAYVRDRHFEYIKANFEARTGQKLPTWICEEEWNIIYDNENL